MKLYYNFLINNNNKLNKYCTHNIFVGKNRLHNNIGSRTMKIKKIYIFNKRRLEVIYWTVFVNKKAKFKNNHVKAIYN